MAAPRSCRATKREKGCHETCPFSCRRGLLARIKPTAPGGYQLGSTAIERPGVSGTPRLPSGPAETTHAKENIPPVMEQYPILFGWMPPQIATDTLGRSLSGLEFALAEEHLADTPVRPAV